MSKGNRQHENTSAISENDMLYRVESECCSAEWDEDTGICLKCREHAEGVMIPVEAND